MIAAAQRLEPAGAGALLICANSMHRVYDRVQGAVGIPILYRFALEHPYWLPAGRSPWDETGFPEGSPSWCSIGVGSATPRTGECPNEQTCPF